MLQEITQVLPEERRHQALELIQRVIKEKQRVEREKIKYLPNEELYRLLPDEYPPRSAHSEENIGYCIGHEHFLSLLDDSSSSELTFSSTCSSSFSNNRCRLPSNFGSYKHTSIMFFDKPNDLADFRG